jgi:flagellar FliL protein
MSEAKKEEAAEGAEKPKGKKKLILIVLGVVLLVVGVGVPMMLMGGKDKKAEEVEEEVEEVKVVEMADLGEYIVNLSDSTAYLKVKLKIEYDKSLLDKLTMENHEGGGGGHGGGASGGGGEEKGGGMHSHLVKREVQMRDAIIRVLSSKKAEELLTTEGKDRLKEELVEALNEAIGLEEPPVMSVYFTEFIVQ